MCKVLYLYTYIFDSYIDYFIFLGRRIDKKRNDHNVTL